ncbi:MAG TPA: ATP-grasp domain-containing protein [Candidatus Polarisedimenticolia bacterium]|nr:ATP-grasp domain-containing protein [Candidatus Polarisedimenticolia bacterium]
MKIVVLEHLTSAPRTDPKHALEAEGRAMRDAVCEDLLRLRGTTVAVLERHAASGTVRPAVGATPSGRLKKVGVGTDRDDAFRTALHAADAALVIAPEEGGLLERLGRLVEEEGRVLLGPSARAIALAGDKLETARCLAAAGLRTPATETLTFASARRVLARRAPPFILKPRDGCGGLGVVLVRRRARIDAAIAAVRRATARHDFLVQEAIAGEDASVAVVSNGGEILALPLCRQRLRRGAALVYTGGETPWRHPLEEAALALARAAVGALAGRSAATPANAVRGSGGARGYFGVDLVLAADGPWVIEINPRLTTSYVGLRRVLALNPAGLIVDAVLGRSLPERIATRGRCRFTRDGRVVGFSPPVGDGGWRSISAGTSAAST